MIDIWDIVSKIAIELHPDRAKELSKKLNSISSFQDFPKLKSYFQTILNHRDVDDLERLWSLEETITPRDVGIALYSASKTSYIQKENESIELVWTGPKTSLVPSRHTEQVLVEVINSSRVSLFITSFVAYNIESILLALRNAVGRGVTINLLMELSRSHGGKIDIDSIDIIRDAIPTANFYKWVSNKSDSIVGSVHAKCAVADGTIAFITSANLTRAALEKNMELGVLVKGGALPRRLEDHLQALITTRIVKKIDG